MSSARSKLATFRHQPVPQGDAAEPPDNLVIEARASAPRPFTGNFSVDITYYHVKKPKEKERGRAWRFESANPAGRRRWPAMNCRRGLSLMAIVYRSVKGSNLTPTEVDNNFHDVDDRITTIEGIDLGKSIASIEVSTDGMMTITYTDATTDSFVLPTINLTQVFKGEWQPLTPYFAGDLITAAGGFYCVLETHTSGSPDFDPNATLGTAGDLYQFWFNIGMTLVYTRSATTFEPLFEMPPTTAARMPAVAPSPFPIMLMCSRWHRPAFRSARRRASVH